jgi:hypothetical protein
MSDTIKIQLDELVVTGNKDWHCTKPGAFYRISNSQKQLKQSGESALLNVLSENNPEYLLLNVVLRILEFLQVPPDK